MGAVVPYACCCDISQVVPAIFNQSGLTSSMLHIKMSGCNDNFVFCMYFNRDKVQYALHFAPEDRGNCGHAGFILMFGNFCVAEIYNHHGM